MRTVMAALLACLFALFVAFPTGATAESPTAAATASCQSVDGGQDNMLDCLPGGRWAQSIGTIQSRSEPAAGLLKGFIDVRGAVGRAMRLTMPNMLMMVTQVLWNSALALNQFASSFDVLTDYGHTLDKSVNNVVNGVMSGGIASTMIVLAVFGVIAAVAFGRGSTGSAMKRLTATLLSIAVLTTMGVAASRDGRDGVTTPTVGSPWWVVDTLNGEINKMTVGVNLGSALTGRNSNMMAYKHRGGGGHNCQDYLYAMHDEYKHLGDGGAKDKQPSAVVIAANQLWEETALRSWVTMQYGNPTAGGESNKRVAANAQQAYCHVLDMETNTPVEVQTDLTNRELGSFIDSSTGKWIFSKSGWIDPWSTAVNKDADEGWDRTDVYPLRAGIFWETCTMDGSSKAVARGGWRALINNLGDAGTGELKGSGGSHLRAKVDDEKVTAVTPDSGSAKGLTAAGNATTDTTKVCSTVLTNGAFHHSKNGKNGDAKNSNLGDAATLGWRFDVPNASSTWSEANMVIPGSGAQQDAKTTINYMYGNNAVDTSGAIGTCVGAFIDGGILALLSFALIISKIMMLLMLLMLVFALVVRMFPFGETANNALKNWFKFACELCMVGALYAALGNIATFISSIFLSVTADMSSTFLYNILAGCSMGIALMVIQLFFSKVLKVRNVFSIGSIMGAVGAGALYNGASRAIKNTTRGAMYRAGADMLRGHRNKGKDGEHSSQQHGAGGASDSADVLNRNADETQSGTKSGTDSRSEAAASSRAAVTSADGGVTEGKPDSDGDSDSENTLNQIADQSADKDGENADDDGEQPSSLMDKVADKFNDTALGSAVRDAKYAGEAGYDRGRHHALGGGTHFAGGLLAAGMAARAFVKNPRLRDVAKRTAKVAATAGIAAAALSNPITAPAGLFFAGKTLLNRDVRHAAAGVVGAGATLADASIHQLNHGVVRGADWFRNKHAERKLSEAIPDSKGFDDMFREKTGITPDQAVQYALDRQVVDAAVSPSAESLSNPFTYDATPDSHHMTVDAPPAMDGIPGVTMPGSTAGITPEQAEAHMAQAEQAEAQQASMKFSNVMRVEDAHRAAMDAQAPTMQYNDPYRDVPAPTVEPGAPGMSAPTATGAAARMQVRMQADGQARQIAQQLAGSQAAQGAEVQPTAPAGVVQAGGVAPTVRMQPVQSVPVSGAAGQGAAYAVAATPVVQPAAPAVHAATASAAPTGQPASSYTVPAQSAPVVQPQTVVSPVVAGPTVQAGSPQPTVTMPVPTMQVAPAASGPGVSAVRTASASQSTPDRVADQSAPVQVPPVQPVARQAAPVTAAQPTVQPPVQTTATPARPMAQTTAQPATQPTVTPVQAQQQAQPQRGPAQPARTVQAASPTVSPIAVMPTVTPSASGPQPTVQSTMTPPVAPVRASGQPSPAQAPATQPAPMRVQPTMPPQAQPQQAPVKAQPAPAPQAASQSTSGTRPTPVRQQDKPATTPQAQPSPVRQQPARQTTPAPQPAPARQQVYTGPTDTGASRNDIMQATQDVRKAAADSAQMMVDTGRIPASQRDEFARQVFDQMQSQGTIDDLAGQAADLRRMDGLSTPDMPADKEQ